MGAKKILIIEDDTQIGNLEQEVLERQDYFCLRAYSGTEAVMLPERERTEALKRLTEELFQYSVITSACDDMKPTSLSLKSKLEIALAGAYGMLSQRVTERGFTGSAGRIHGREHRHGTVYRHQALSKPEYRDGAQLSGRAVHPL